MSKILIGSNPNNPQVVGSVDFSATNEEKATQLPTPTGYRILCALPEVEKEYESGILKADENNLITSFIEKPAADLLPDWKSEVGKKLKAKGKEYLASMGIYLFNRKLLFVLT